MKVIDTVIPEIKVIQPTIFFDDRGYFFESFNEKKFSSLITKNVEFVQDNQSMSHKNVLRGLHFQLPPFAQAKLVRAVVGSIFDVAVDIRRSSANFGKWVGVELSAENQKQLYVPVGFAHGFLTLCDTTVVAYRASAFYNSASEGSILWNDPDIDIHWPIKTKPIVSKKDSQASLMADAITF